MYKSALSKILNISIFFIFYFKKIILIIIIKIKNCIKILEEIRKNDETLFIKMKTYIISWLNIKKIIKKRKENSIIMLRFKTTTTFKLSNSKIWENSTIKQKRHIKYKNIN